LLYSLALNEAVFGSELQDRLRDIASISATELAEPPLLRIDNGPTNTAVASGDKLELTCDSFGNPPPTIFWLFNNSLIGQESSLEGNTVEILHNFGLQTLQKGTTISKLHVDCFDRSKAGVYTCVAQNGFAVKTKSALVSYQKGSEGPRPECGAAKRIVSDKQFAPRVYMWTEMRIEISGANVQLFCRAFGNPAPRITWYRGDAKIHIADESPQFEQIHTGEFYEILPNGDLLVKSGQMKTDGGPQYYKCTASSELGDESVEPFIYFTLARKTSNKTKQLKKWDEK